MKNMTKRAFAMLLVLVLCISLLPGVQLTANAATVDYVYSGSYIYNWGSRGTVATFMSPNAEAFYADNNVSYDDLASLSGSSSKSSVPGSPLYQRLKTLMSSNHDHITSYDETKNLYKYTDCQNGGGKISSFYSGNAIGPEWGNGWNREHTWPNSKGLGGSDENDIMMLRPTSTSENSSRGNTAYGESSNYYDPNKYGLSLHGDVARIMLYTYVRWGNTSYMWGTSGVMESPEVLLKWMEEDPVDTWELGRNDSVEAITGTRNVFVDYPELAFILFGEAIPENYTSPSGKGEAASAFTITATSADPAKGTVSVSGRTITATPAAGYEASGYTILSGTASVNQNGNRFTVQPSSDVTVQIQFAEKIPMPTVSELKTGDQVVIYVPAYSKALSSQVVSTHYLMGVDVDEENGMLVGYASTETWTVTKNSDNTYSFSNGGETLGMAAEYASMRPGEANDKWALVGLGGSLYNVKNTVRGNYMEWYAEKENWSTYDTATDSQFQLSFYVIGKGLLTGEGETPEQPEIPDQPAPVATATKLTALPVDGDVIAIYNSNKAMGNLPSGSKLAGVSVELDGDTMSLNQEVAQLTVVTEGDKYIFMLDGKYLTSGTTGNALSFESTLTDCARWTIASATADTWYITNVGAAYNGTHNQALEYFYGFTTYGHKETAIYQMQLYKVDAQEPPAQIEKLTAPRVEKDGQKLTWNAVENADYYEIYRATKKSGKYTCIAIHPETSYEDIAVAAKAYYYKVKAVYEADETKSSGLSNAVSLARKCDVPIVGTTEDIDSGKPIVVWDKVVGAKKYTVYRATSETGKYKKLGTTTKLYYTDTKAVVGTTYFYKVVANASSSKYNSAYSQAASITCICGTPSMTVKIDANTGKPSLSWKKVSGAVSYRVFRDGEILTIVTGLSYADATAAVDTEYGYQIQALGKTEALYGQLCATKFVTTGMAKPVLKGSVDALGKPVLTWNAVEGAHSYMILRSTKSSKGYEGIAVVEDVTTYTDETAATGKTYYYKVVAYGYKSDSALSSYVKLAGKCAAPEIGVFIDGKSGKLVISWEKIGGAKKYTVYRATSEDGKYKKLGTTKKLSYTDTKAAVGTAYYYKVVANASSSKYSSGYSNVAAGVAHCATPVVKVTTVAASGKPSLSWNKVTAAVKYVIYVSTPDGFRELATVTGTKFVDEAAQPGEYRRYVVEAVPANETCRSFWSDEVSVRATCAQPKLTGGLTPDGKPYGQWENVEGAAGYIVYRSTKKSSGYKATDLFTDGNMFFDETAKKGKTYYYKVVAVSSSGDESAFSNVVKIKSK